MAFAGRLQAMPQLGGGAPRRPVARARHLAAGAAVLLAVAGLLALPAGAAWAGGGTGAGSRLAVPASARQLIVVSSPAYDQPRGLARVRGFERTGAASAWKPAFGAWQAEIGSGGLRDVRREGDGATPTGVYPLGVTIYGIDRNPGGLHGRYHRLVCGDWWDEDPYSARYNRFVHWPCGSEPPFARRSEPLWTETRAYPYFAVVEYNEHPTISGADAPGSGIFVHAWIGEPTEGCVALHLPALLRVLRWLRPADHPVIEIGSSAELGHLPPPPA
jgi:L,D-peptidoglycan transpeptidase YkuD (ErfK/YbiS/YcfS/YnhG family)